MKSNADKAREALEHAEDSREIGDFADVDYWLRRAQVYATLAVADSQNV